MVLVSTVFANALESPRARSARAYGMGEAYGAVADDWGALNFNPAGLSQIQHVGYAGHFGRYYLENTNPQTDLGGAFVLPLSEYKPTWQMGSVGGYVAHTGRAGDSSITRMHLAWGLPSQKIFTGRLRFLPPEINERLDIGTALHIDRMGRMDASFLGMGLDLGILYHHQEKKMFWQRGWKSAFVLQDIDMKSTAKPVTIRWAASWQNPVSTLAMDLVLRGGSIALLPGIEVPFFRKLLTARVGTTVEDGPGGRGLSLGLGAAVLPWQLDVAYGFPMGAPKSTNERVMVALSYRFGVPRLSQVFYDETLKQSQAVEDQLADLEVRKKALEKQVQDLGKEVRHLSELAGESINKRVRAEDDVEKSKKQKDQIQDEIQRLDGKLKKKTKSAVEPAPQEIPKNWRKPGQGAALSYEVKAGDSLRSIAREFYGDPNLWQVIYDANKKELRRGAPEIGSKIKIP